MTGLNAYGSEGLIYERYNQQYFSPLSLTSILRTTDEFSYLSTFIQTCFGRERKDERKSQES